jgi:hypothetical protein
MYERIDRIKEYVDNSMWLTDNEINTLKNTVENAYSLVINTPDIKE